MQKYKINLVIISLIVAFSIEGCGTENNLFQQAIDEYEDYKEYKENKKTTGSNGLNEYAEVIESESFEEQQEIAENENYEEQQEAVEDEGAMPDGYWENYLPGFVCSSTINTYVHYARVYYSEFEGDYVVAVGCTIINASEDNVVFWSVDYSLENNGIITDALYSDYDGITLAPGGSFFTEILFSCFNTSRSGDTLHMTMHLGDDQIHLGPEPLEEEIHSFSGLYLSSSPSFDDIYIIGDNGDGTYNIIWIGDALGQVYQVLDATLDEDNLFTVRNGVFKWDSEKCCFYRYDDFSESYDTSNPYSKQFFQN